MPARSPAYALAASSTACTSESWPTLGQEWFMSRMATSMRSGPRGGTESVDADVFEEIVRLVDVAFIEAAQQ